MSRKTTNKKKILRLDASFTEKILKEKFQNQNVCVRIVDTSVIIRGKLSEIDIKGNLRLDSRTLVRASGIQSIGIRSSQLTRKQGVNVE